MRRRTASSKMNNVVHSGWMIKSPPERKLNAPFKIFRSQWKRRYFVLRKPSGSLPDQYELHYYKDEKCAAKKGSIDLEQCEQIIESLDSEQFPFLLAIKTVCRNKVRTYYLAVDTEQEMGSWVQWLCHVCGMKQEDEPTDLPEPRPPSVTIPPSGQGGITSSSTAAVSNGRPWNHNTHHHHHHNNNNTAAAPSHSSGMTVTTSNNSTTPGLATSQPLNISHRVPSDSSLDSSPSYIPLDNCTTGKPQRTDLGGSVESVPDFNAPSPPMARGSQHDPGANSGNEDDVFLSGSCQRPPKRNKEPAPLPRGAASMDLYTVPPVRPPRPDEKSTGDHVSDDEGKTSSVISYDIPPPKRQSPRRSTGSIGRKDSVGSSSGKQQQQQHNSNLPTECYDYPPPRSSSTTSSDVDAASHDPSLPSPYQNIPSTSKSPPASQSGFDLNQVVPPPRPHQVGNRNLGYDIPRATKNRSSSLAPPMGKLSLASLSSSPTSVAALSNSHHQPPPRPHRPSQATNARTYLNTQDSQLTDVPPPPLPPNTREEYSNISSASSSSSNPPAIPPPRHNSNSDAHHHDGSPQTGVYHMLPPSSASSSTSSSTSSSVVPPARPPARSGTNSTTPPPIAARNPDITSSQNQDKGDDGGVIFSTNRTKSFKREHNVNVPVMKSNKAKTLPMTMPVPAPRPVPHSRPTTYSSSEDGDEEKTHLPISLLRSVPPPQDAESELKYIDLELPDSMGGQDAPKSSQSRHHHHHHQTQHNHAERSKPDSSIEYRQIDFVKTKALKDTKKEKDRQNDDHA